MSTVGTWTLPASVPSGIGEQVTEQNLALGNDIFFDRDFAISPAGDWLSVTGEAALRAALYRRLMTRPGEYRARPDYGVGLPSFVKKRANSTTVDELRVAIVDQLSLEPRIEEVVDVAVERFDGGLRIGLTVRSAGRTVRFQPQNFSESDLLSLARTQRR